MTDPIAAARAMIEPLTGHTPRPWTVGRDLTIGPNGCGVAVIVAANTSQAAPTDARLIAAAPDLRDMVATLADAVEAERAKVAAAYEAAAGFVMAQATFERSSCEPVGPNLDPPLSPAGMAERKLRNIARERTASVCETNALVIRALTPADAQAALDKLLAEARQEGWRAGRDAATEPLTSLAAVLRKSENSYHQSQASAMLERVAAIRALPEPKDTSHDAILALLNDGGRDE